MSIFGDFFKQANLVGSIWQPPSGADAIKVTNPATGDMVGTVPNAGRAETRAAIAAADEAFHTFSKTTANERAGLLRRMHDVMLDNQDELVD